jgi:hypothetical protein
VSKAFATRSKPPAIQLYKIEGENPNLECPDLVRGRVGVRYGLPSLKEESTQQETGGTEPLTIWPDQHPCLEKRVCKWGVSAQALTVLAYRTEDLTSVRGYFCSAATKTEPIAPITPAVNNISLVGLKEFSLFLKDFDFAPNVAPTFDQIYLHLITHTVLIASGGDKLLIDPLFDWIVDSGYTSHMCNNKSLFTELRPIQSAITTAGVPAKVTGVGTAKIQVELDNQIINFSLLNTLLVPSLPVNLISQSKLESNYYFTTLHGYQARSRDTHELVLEARLIEGLYVVNQEKRFETALSVKESLVI